MPSEKQMIITAVTDLKELQKSYEDEDMIHKKADKILLRFVPEEVASEWNNIDKWYCMET